MNREAVKRLTAAAVSVLLVVGVLFSAAYIFAHIGHGHDCGALGGGCSVCAHMAASESLLKHVSSVCAGSAPIIGVLFVLLSARKPSAFCAACSTPVRLKIRLNR